MISLGHSSARPRGAQTWFGNPLTWTDRANREWNITLEWSQEQGAPRPVGMTVSLATLPASMTSALLRELPIGELAQIDLNNNSARQPRAVRATKAQPKTVGPQRGTPLDRATLETVARLYREALQNGKPPAETIANALSISPSTAAKRIMAARKMNILGPAAPGRKGETI